MWPWHSRLWNMVPYFPWPHVSGYFWIRNFFFAESKISPFTQRIQIKFACPRTSDGIWIHSRETRPTRCPAILVYCSIRDWTLCYRIPKYPDSPSTCYRIPCGFIFFPRSIWRADSKYPDSLPNLPDACGWKPYLGRKSWGFKNIRPIRVDGAPVRDGLRNFY